MVFKPSTPFALVAGLGLAAALTVSAASAAPLHPGPVALGSGVQQVEYYPPYYHHYHHPYHHHYYHAYYHHDHVYYR